MATTSSSTASGASATSATATASAPASSHHLHHPGYNHQGYSHQSSHNQNQISHQGSLRSRNESMMSIDLTSHQWINDLANIMENDFKQTVIKETRLRSVRAFTQFFGTYYAIYEDELVDKIVIPFFSHADSELDLDVRKASVNLLLDVATLCFNYKHCLEALQILKKVLFKPFKCQQTSDQSNDLVYIVGNADVIDSRFAVCGITQLFKTKLYSLPIEPAVYIFETMVDYLDLTYKHPLQAPHPAEISVIRQELFSTLMSLRANKYHQLGLIHTQTIPHSMQHPHSYPHHPQHQNQHHHPQHHGSSGATTNQHYHHGSSSQFSSPYLLQNMRLPTNLCIGPTLLKYSPFILCRKPPVINQTSATSNASNQGISGEPSLLSTEHPVVINLTNMLNTLIECINQETDWDVLKSVLESLPMLFLNRTLILSVAPDVPMRLCQALCNLSKCQDIQARFNKKVLSQGDVIAHLVKSLASMVYYRNEIDSKVQKLLLSSFENTLKFSRQPRVSLFTTCLIEMHDSLDMMRFLPQILMKLSKFSATVNLAMSQLEFLSYLILFPKLYENFAGDEYICIFAIALPYTNPFKFNEYVISMAHRVIAMWFLRCRPSFRTEFVDYIKKHLNSNVIQPFKENQVINHPYTPVPSQTASQQTPPILNTPATSPFDQRKRSCSLNDHNNIRRFEFRQNSITLLQHSNQVLQSSINQNSNNPQCTSSVSQQPPNSPSSSSSFSFITTNSSGSSGASANVSGSSNSGATTSNCNINSQSRTPVLTDSPCSLGGDANLLSCQQQHQIVVAAQYQTSQALSKQLNEELIETCTDLISRYMHGQCSAVAQRSPAADLLVDRNTSQTWLVGNSLITISTSRCHNSSTTSNLTSGSGPNSSSLIDGSGGSSHDFTVDNCQCWSQGWAEILIRRPTGNTCWLARLQNNLGSMLPAISTSHSNMSALFNSMTLSEIDHPHLHQHGSSSDSSSLSSSSVNAACSDQHESSVTNVSTSTLSAGTTTSLGASSGLHPAFVFLQFFHDSSSQPALINNEIHLDQISLSSSVTSNSASMMHSEHQQQSQLNNSNGSVTNGNISSGGCNINSGCNQVNAANILGSSLLNASSCAPILLPKDGKSDLALKNFDRITPYETHKIGVVYVDKGQANKRAEILSNRYGSRRYIEFLKNLGTLIKLSDVDNQIHFIGGLDINGLDGEHTYFWQDSITQVVFHVATSMPNRDNDPNCNDKNRHIGNDHVCIVYNDSDEDFELCTIKGDGQCILACIVVTPLEPDTNMVMVKTLPDLAQILFIMEPKYVSNAALSIYTRQLAIHLNLACMIYERRQRPGDESGFLAKSPYVSNWVERLRCIKRIRKRINEK